MRRSFRQLATSIAFTLLVVALVSAADSAKSDKTKSQGKLDQATLEKAFSESLSGATLVGSFTTDGNEGKSGDRYQLVSAKKLQGDSWIFTYKAKIGDQMVDLPVPIQVLWAGDTPVMTLTDLTIPGLGTFTARVMFHGDRYAGTWQHGEHGGHMWGKIEKAKATSSNSEKK